MHRWKMRESKSIRRYACWAQARQVLEKVGQSQIASEEYLRRTRGADENTRRQKDGFLDQGSYKDMHLWIFWTE